jgi:hypothetical protein
MEGGATGRKHLSQFGIDLFTLPKRKRAKGKNGHITKLMCSGNGTSIS